MLMKLIYTVLFSFSLLLCKGQVNPILVLEKNSAALQDTTFVNIANYSSAFVLDIKYATNDNFLKTKVYDCATCYLRYKTVKKLILISTILAKKKIKIKLFDCYRPLDIQRKMWKLVPDPTYVADPSKGSIHNRGCAVDMTLIDEYGADLEMGTPFDFFGVEASHGYQKLSTEAKNNRVFLKDLMTTNGFLSFDSEWWHYNLIGGSSAQLANFKWNCN